IIEMENVAVHVADNRINKDLLQQIITSIINEPEYSEELKVLILDAIGISDNNDDLEESPF
ncbi:MAG: hypothetical protein KAF40_02190, partial [Flavihumibacter sp.]|nr:hypothetical protein [Flavihumibacter sp.]